MSQTHLHLSHPYPDFFPRGCMFPRLSLATFPAWIFSMFLNGVFRFIVPFTGNKKLHDDVLSPLFGILSQASGPARNRNMAMTLPMIRNSPLFLVISIGG
jgi:hypothetical protein